MADEVIVRTTLAKLRRSTEMACGYPDVLLHAAESRALLELIEELEDRVQTLETGEAPR